MTREVREDGQQPEVKEGGTVGTPEKKRKGHAPGWLESRPAMAAMAAVVAAIGTLILPTWGLVSNGGELCYGYVDVPRYYENLAPLTLGAAALGAVLGAVIGWPGHLLARGRGSGWHVGCAIAAVVIAGVACAVVSAVWAIYPGC